ncbi:MMPL family transporter [Streptomyces sp. NBC_00306]|uniref:MMPL family transporter n=1 Tax=Streptomyces sp. NBC_00306 TaxID=2975708 RepID=UPI002E298108|nr:MMPL family transporter [Streptomyces sp. NBC_00306]
MLLSVGRWCARRPKRTVAAWLLLLTALAAAVTVFGTVTSEAVTIPGSDSQAARDAGEAFGDAASGPQPVLLHTTAGEAELTSSAQRAAVEAAARAIADVDHVVAVATPYDRAGGSALSADGRTGRMLVELDLTGRDITPAITRAIVDAAGPAADAGIEVTPGGDLAEAEDKGSTGHSEIIGLAAAFVVLALGFGSLVAAGVPLLTGALGLAGSLCVVGLVGHLVDMPSSGTTIAAMIGLGVGIDYTLFCLTRFRELLAAGAGVEDAVARTMAGSGKSVLFAGAAVIAALAGLALGGLPLLHALALAPGIAVLVAVAATLTLLPAVLALLGPRLAPKPVTARVPRFMAKLASKRSASRPAGSDRVADAGAGTGTDARPRGWGRIAEYVAARPWRCLAAGLVLTGVLAAPAAHLTFGQLDGGDRTVGTASRTAYDRTAAAFGPGANGPLQVTGTLSDPAAAPDDPRLAPVTAALRTTPGVAAVAPAELAADGRHARWQVTPETAPGDPDTAALVHRLREDTRGAGSGLVTHVGGATAAQADLNERLARRMPLVVGFVLAVAGLLLLPAFRSPVIAVKAAVLNLVSVAAAYGVLTAVFQWGWGAQLIGLEGAVPIPGYVPLLMFAVLFGLSMDYEVFLLSAIRAAYVRDGDNRGAVISGLAGTGRIVTSAALIMVSVFLSYVLSDDPVVKMFGIGLAVAVALDATVVRGILVPSTMVLLGRVNWWLPAWLDRLLPHMGIEDDGHGPARPPKEAVADAALASDGSVS